MDLPPKSPSPDYGRNASNKENLTNTEDVTVSGKNSLNHAFDRTKLKDDFKIVTTGGSDENISNDTYCSINIPMEQTDSRFHYSPKTILERLLVSIRFKNQLDTSYLAQIQFNRLFKYALILLLAVLSVILTPSLLPKWIGIKLPTPSDLCQYPDRKLENLRKIIRRNGNVQESLFYVSVQRSLLKCMNNSASTYYHGNNSNPPRFLWPAECDYEKAYNSMFEVKCMKQNVNICSKIGGLLGFLGSIGGKCKRKSGPDLCYTSTDQDRMKSLTNLEMDRSMNKISNKNSTIQPNKTGQGSKILNKFNIENGNTRIQDLFSRLASKVDISADLFIIYTLIAISFGTPLVIYRREKKTTIVSFAFGLTKGTFIVLCLFFITIIDSFSLLFEKTDLGHIFRNFLNDPCYLDPSFTSRRIKIIANTCKEVSDYEYEYKSILHKMDAIFYDIKRFGYCRDKNRTSSEHPALYFFNQTRMAYKTRTMRRFSTWELNAVKPPGCNETMLNNMTNSAPSDGGAKWKTIFSSGVLALMLLKFVLTGWTIRIFAYYHPMTIHNGKVAIWGSSTDRKDQKLSETEQKSIKMYARDKHLLSFFLFSFLLIVEIVLVFYAISNPPSIFLLDTFDSTPKATNYFTSFKCPKDFFIFKPA